MRISLAIQTVRAEIECPACGSRYILVEGEKASCCGCSNVWNWKNPPKVLRGSR